MQHLRTISDIPDPNVLRMIMARASLLKRLRRQGHVPKTLEGRVLAMVFGQPSTRTRLSFESGISMLGGSAVTMQTRDLQLKYGETLRDTARVMGRYADVLLLRAKDHEHVETFAQYAGIPVINGMTAIDHPCQVLTDLFTVFERRENAFDLQWTWIGPMTSTAMGYAGLSAMANINMNFALPQEDENAKSKLERFIAQGAPIKMFTDATAAVEDADIVITDQWPQDSYDEEVRSAFRVSSSLLQGAHDDYLFLHKLPASRGEEVTEEVLEGRHSVVYEQAGNRLCVQQAIIEWLLDVRLA
ncbi:MAG: ornithine carbamoyltransferase [Myxococcales bacterium]|nr:ornithine carbamoyltransferase [Myxococcales bacterium]|tara:strand:+ start:974 stop:1876 length:903 start_codon:yes stop_codon:yes gene_type:complete